MKRGNTTMKAAQIKLFSKKEAEATDQSGFTRMEATGTVYVNSGKQTVTGSQAIVDNQAQTITLSGNVVLSQGKDVLAADRLVIDMATGRARGRAGPGQIDPHGHHPFREEEGREGRRSWDGARHTVTSTDRARAHMPKSWQGSRA